MVFQKIVQYPRSPSPSFDGKVGRLQCGSTSGPPPLNGVCVELAK